MSASGERLPTPWRQHWMDARAVWDSTELTPAHKLLGWLLSMAQFLTLSMYVRWIGMAVGSRCGYDLGSKFSTELYSLAKPAIFLLMLRYGCWTGGWWLAPAFTITEVFLFLLSVVVLRDIWREPYSYARSLILALLNFLEAILGFAIIYLRFDAVTGANNAVDAVYFSAVTATTVGYGDLAPTADGRIIVMLQLLYTLAFVTMLFAPVASKAWDQEHERR